MTDDLEGFIGYVKRLQDRVNDPSDILGSVLRDLGEFADKFKKRNLQGQPVDHIELPQQLSPTTRDQNELYVDPSDGPYSPPMPGSPERQPKFRSVVLTPSAGVSSGVRRPQLLPPLPNDEISDFYRNDPAWMLQIRR